MNPSKLVRRSQIRRYIQGDLQADLAAGLTGATAGVPQAMAFAIVAGISPVYGLYAAIVSTIVGALLGTTTYMTTGPTNALAVVVGSTLAPFADGGDITARLVTLTFLVGAIELGMGLLRLGGLTRYVSGAVMTGFVTGAASLVLLGQLGHLTGIVTDYENPVLRLGQLLTRVPQLHVETTIIGLVTIAIIVYLHRTRLSPFATLVAIAITGVAVALLNWDGAGVELVRDMAAIPNALPGITLPDAALAPEMLPAALALAVLALVQTTALAQSVEVPDEGTPGASREFSAQGASNLLGALFQSMPSGGSLSRTAVNIKSGAHTRWANVFAGIFVALIMLLFGGLAERIALAALAGQLVVAATSLIDIPQMRFVWRASHAGRWAMLATLTSTLVLPLEYSVYVGVALSLLLYIRQSSSIRLTRLEPAGDYRFREIDPPDVLPDSEPVLLSLQGNLFFAAMRELIEKLPSPNGARRPVVILRLRGDDLLAGTGVTMLLAYNQRLRARQGKLILCGVESPIYETLQRTGALTIIGPDAVFGADEFIFESAQHALDYAKNWLIEQENAELDPAPA